MSAFLTNALDGNGVSVHVDSVPKGAKCGCFCPRCQAPLIAKNGSSEGRAHHFAHTKGFSCKSATESDIHKMGKQVIKESKKIMLPESSDPSFPSGLVYLRNVELEKWDSTFKIKPDIEGTLENGEKLWIELRYWHPIDRNKRKIIINNHIKCIEVDLSLQALDKEKMTEFLTNSADDRKWICAIPSRRTVSKSSLYQRNPIYDTLLQDLQNIFYTSTLKVRPPEPFFTQSPPIDLREIGYHNCVINQPFKGFKSGLLFNGSNSNQPLLLSVRGRQRNKSFKRPKGISIIDVIIKRNASYNILQKLLEKGLLTDNNWINVHYVQCLWEIA